MTRNNRFLIATLAALAAILGGIKWYQSRHVSVGVEPIVLYLPLPHPYCNAVGEGGIAYAEDSGKGVRVVVGQESTQANVNTNVESMYTLGHQGFAIYPVDPAGSKGLFARLQAGGRQVVCYGAEPMDGSAASFAVATDTSAAATMAAEELIRLMGGRGRILNVLESLTDANTPVRKAAIEAVVAKYPQVEIVQTVGDVTTEAKAREKIESALVARGDEVDGVICTGYTTTVAAAVLLSERNAKSQGKRIRFVGLDTDERVLEAIRLGHVDATLAQNPFGHGYISCALIDLMQEGWQPVKPYQFIDSGAAVVTKENVDDFQGGIERLTEEIVADLKGRYLVKEGRE
ncbi:sugar ABC transporter substrate-binding protein [Pelagicoccus sp. SDUM812005]|uniref:sugar ABC transporter substrate-binding protein n=1 Tax=Pelagicoccus sp. SDUM812005 TaxID=3041257 RepID=UPI00280C4FFB|nr:sugar ABC transporter substrate-binding protein [Pelagicoccus sp. SDUM812005]MDQ8179369.1 sugar ABC transporter substrate-binding protein [Pelagicoccus sp. SDUM812005]